MLCCTVSKRTSVLSAAVFWCIGVFSTALKGHALLEAAGKLEQPIWFSRLPLATVCIGSVLGILKGHFMFSKINNKNISRILQMERLPRWHECYRWQFYIFLRKRIFAFVLSPQQEGGRTFYDAATNELSCVSQLFVYMPSRVASEGGASDRSTRGGGTRA